VSLIKRKTTSLHNCTESSTTYCTYFTDKSRLAR